MKLVRAAGDVSEKVTWSAVALLAASAVTAVITNGWNDESTALALGSLVSAVVGYFKADKVDVAAAVESSDTV